MPAAASAQSCSAFRTCAEAMQSLRSGNTRLDKDGDGIPCESLCKGYSGSGASGSSSGRSSGGSIYIAPAPARASKPQPSQRAAQAPSGQASLVSVGDGDTIRVVASNGQKATIRLACIDAPETAQGESGAQATSYLRQLLAMGPLELRSQTVDRYGRTVAEVEAGGRNVNLQMVRAGMAYAYRQYLSGCDQAAYLGAESQAEQQQLGVWRYGGTEQRPWDFRKSR